MAWKSFKVKYVYKLYFEWFNKLRLMFLTQKSTGQFYYASNYVACLYIEHWLCAFIDSKWSSTAAAEKEIELFEFTILVVISNTYSYSYKSVTYLWNID